MQEILGERVYLVRRRRKWTQRKLAQEAGLSRAQIARIESGNGGISVERLRSLAQVLGVSIDYLVGTFEEGVISE